MTQAPGVLKWGAGVGHDQQSPSATCALRGAQPPGRQPKRHVAQRCASTEARPKRHMGVGGCAQPPSSSSRATCPHMVFLR